MTIGAWIALAAVVLMTAVGVDERATGELVRDATRPERR